MGLFDKLFQKGSPKVIEVTTEKNVLYLPVEGEVIPLQEIEDEVFSLGVLGAGCGIRPTDETVYAPADGTVRTVAETLHAVGLETDDGVEVLIHVGMDTVDMKGAGFKALVNAGQRVRCGEPLLTFDKKKILAAGHPLTTAFVVPNSEDIGAVTVLATGMLGKLTAALKIER